MPHGNSASGPFRIKSFQGTPQEERRATFVLAFLSTKSEAVARKASGLSKNALPRITAMFHERGHVFNGERTGRPRVHDTALMELAYDTLVEYTEGFLTGRELLDLLIKGGHVEANADVDTFLMRLTEYVMGQGHRLIKNSTKTIFFISLRDIHDRREYSLSMLQHLDEFPLDMLIFIDETTLEESPHPKGVVSCARVSGLWHTCSDEGLSNIMAAFSAYSLFSISQYSCCCLRGCSMHHACRLYCV